MNTARNGATPSGATGMSASNELDLPSVAVAPDADVEDPERDLVRPAVQHLAAHQDQPGARGQGRHPRRQALAEGHLEVEDLEEAAHRGRLAAWEDERVDGLELVSRAYRGCLRAAAAECRQVFADVALEGEDAYPKDGQFPLSGRERSVPGGAGFASFAHN